MPRSVSSSPPRRILSLVLPFLSTDRIARHAHRLGRIKVTHGDSPGGLALQERAQRAAPGNLQVLLALSRKPQADAADALAIALCHAHMSQSVARLASGGGGKVRSGRVRRQ